MIFSELNDVIRDWMSSQNLCEYFGDIGPCYRTLATEAVSHFNFFIDSNESELCFDIAIDILDEY